MCGITNTAHPPTGPPQGGADAVRIGACPALILTTPATSIVTSTTRLAGYEGLGTAQARHTSRVTCFR